MQKSFRQIKTKDNTGYGLQYREGLYSCWISCYRKPEGQLPFDSADTLYTLMSFRGTLWLVHTAIENKMIYDNTDETPKKIFRDALERSLTIFCDLIAEDDDFQKMILDTLERKKAGISCL